MKCCGVSKMGSEGAADTKDVKLQLSMDEVKAIADGVANVPYDESVEGPIPFTDYNGLGKCTYTALAMSKTATEGTCPHMLNMAPPPRPTGVAETALDFVGNTPLIKLDRLAKALELPAGVELMCKAECYSAGGSVKDRIALRMIEQAEKEGRIKPGDVLIEPTSGNTGIGLCMAGAIKGYKVIITMPLKMSGEKLNMMKALGALIYRTPTEAGWRDTNSHIALALRMQQKIPNAHVLDQYQNTGNPMAHYEGTGQEIVNQTGGKLDYMVATAGTGGTLTGLSRKLKEEIPDIKMVGVDPKGSILALPETLNDEGKGVGYQVEGIGYDFIPNVLDRESADHWVKTEDAESFKCARSIIRHEGIMVGGSAGSCMAGALKAIKELGIKQGRVCVLFSDSTRNYMSKFLDDAWMEEKGFPTDVY